MKKILIIGDGDTNYKFIQRISQTYTGENIYYVVEPKAQDYENINQDRFKFYEFDPTSEYKLANLLKMEFFEIFILLDEPQDITHTIKNIRAMKKNVHIIVLSNLYLEPSDANILVFNSSDILASRLIDYLPNMPVIAQNVGLGNGEIMEVSIPFGSSFVYRHIGVIEQKDWKIAAIYRANELILPNRSSMIHPNDTLLLIGQPNILKSVYLAAKRELGQFPEPFGSRLYMFIDMDRLELKTLPKLMARAAYIQKKLAKSLFVRVINPNNFEAINEIKKYRCEDITVAIKYDVGECEGVFSKDIIQNHIGLIMTSSEIFADDKIKKMFYEASKPVFKLADKSISKLKDVVAIVNDSRDLEKMSSTIFDISEQMGYSLELYNYLNEHQEIKEQVIEHFVSLSKIFSKTIKITKDNQNPIKTLRKRDNFIQVLPFTRHITRKEVTSLLSTNSEKLYFKLDNYHQLFIPIQL